MRCCLTIPVASPDDYRDGGIFTKATITLQDTEVPSFFDEKGEKVVMGRYIMRWVDAMIGASYHASSLIDGIGGIITIDTTNEMYLYNPNTGVFETNYDKYIDGDLLSLDAHNTLRKTIRQEIIANIQSLTLTGHSNLNRKDAVVFGNVTLLFGTEEPYLQTSVHSPAYLATRRINVDYDMNATCPGFDKWISAVLDEKEVAKFFEIIASALVNKSYEALFFIVGKTRTGKTTLRDIFQIFLGERNMESIKLKELYQDQPKSCYRLSKVLLNWPNENDTFTMKDTGLLKDLSGGKEVTAKKLYKDSYTTKVTSTLIFSGNEMADINIEDESVANRTHIIEFKNQFERNDRIKQKIITKCTSGEEMSGILNHILEAYVRLTERGHFERYNVLDDVIKNQKKYSDPLELFLETWCYVDDECLETPQDLRSAYQTFCMKHDIAYTYTQISFGQAMSKKGYPSRQQKVDGRNSRYHEIGLIPGIQENVEEMGGYFDE